MAKEPMDANTALLEEQLLGIRAAAQESPDVTADLDATPNTVGTGSRPQPEEDASSPSWDTSRDGAGMFNHPSGVMLTMPPPLHHQAVYSMPHSKEDPMETTPELDLQEIARWFGHPGTPHTTRSPSAERLQPTGEETYNSNQWNQQQQAQMPPRETTTSNSLNSRLDMLYQ
jgi:hypothetical protein